MKFEDITYDGFDALQGGSSQVLANAFAMDTGKALTEADLFTSGTYILHQVQGQYYIVAEKRDNGRIKVRAIVNKDAELAFAEELRRHRDANELSPPDERVMYSCPPWILALLLFEHNVSPHEDEAAFERALYKHYPNFWLDKARAPKR